MLSLLLVQHALVPSIVDARTRPTGRPGGDISGDPISQPYLKISEAPPLRFRAAPPPPDLTSKPAAYAALSPAPTTVSAMPSHAPVTTAAEPAGLPTPPTTGASSPADMKPPVAILPDDTQPATRPEDFLPFFQFPTGASSVNAPARPPVPGQLPASSATYQQR